MQNSALVVLGELLHNEGLAALTDALNDKRIVLGGAFPLSERFFYFSFKHMGSISISGDIFSLFQGNNSSLLHFFKRIIRDIYSLTIKPPLSNWRAAVLNMLRIVG